VRLHKHGIRMEHNDSRSHIPHASPRLNLQAKPLTLSASCRHAQAAQQRAGVRFLKHDIRTEHDDASDVARLYRIRATPTFAFLVGGAKVGSRV